MSDPGFGVPGPFDGLPMFRDLARLFSGQQSVNWEVTRQIGWWLATEGQSEPNVDPLERIRFEELLRAAEMHVGDATGLDTAGAGGVLRMVPITRGDWTLRGISALRPLVEALAAALATGGGSDGSDTSSEGMTHGDAGADLLGDLGRVLGPVLVGIQAGYMLGHLAQRALGQYELPIYREPLGELVVVPANVATVARQWSLPPDDLAMWVCVREVVSHVVLSRPHVNERISTLVGEYVALFDTDSGAFESSLADIDPTNPMAFQSILGNPETLLGVTHSPAQDAVKARLTALTAAVAGYVDHVTDTVGHGLVGSYQMIDEAMKRRRVEPSDGMDFARRLLGLGLERADYERGQAFVAGVLGRSGPEGLRRLWHSDRELPTPAELDAPGLWLARIDLPDQIDLPD